jgi:hypothetical protein
MAEAALNLDDEFIRMRRVTRGDLMDKGVWLCKRIKENWPHLQDRQMMGWLMTCCDSNEYLFIRTDKAFLLAQMYREFVEPYPWVKELFVLAELDYGNYQKDSDGEAYQNQENARAIHQAATLYEDLLRWAQTIGANEIIVDKFTDVPMEDKDDPKNRDTIRKRVNQRLFKAEELFFRIDPERVRKI